MRRNNMPEQTVTVRKGGSYLTIPVLAIERYMAKGYDLVDNHGNVLKACVPNDIGTLQKAFVDKSAEIERLTQEVKRLKGEIEKLLAFVSECQATTVPKQDSVEVVEEKTIKKGRGSKKNQ